MYQGSIRAQEDVPGHGMLDYERMQLWKCVQSPAGQTASSQEWCHEEVEHWELRGVRVDTAGMPRGTSSRDWETLDPRTLLLYFRLYK